MIISICWAGPLYGKFLAPPLCVCFGVIVRRKRLDRVAGEMGENQLIVLVPCHCPLPGDRSATATTVSPLSSGQKWEVIEGARN